MITRLTGRGFKGLREFDIQPSKINVLIGANGTGKTNFADLIDFFSLIARRGLVEAFGEYGGLEQVRTRTPRGAFTMRFRLELGEDKDRGIKRVSYGFELSRAANIQIKHEVLDAVVYERPIRRDDKGIVRPSPNLEEITIGFERDGTTIKSWHDPQNTIEAQNIEALFLDESGEDELLLFSRYMRGARLISNYIASWRVYNIEPGAVRRSIINDDQELRRNGENIVPYVARLLQKTDQSEQLLAALQEVVPYIDEIKPDRLLNLKTLRFTERDTRVDFQLPEMSDGTIRLLGLFAVLLQATPPPVIVIEEPENALHLYAIQRFLQRVRDTATRRRNPSQIFLTTHSPIVLDEALGLDSQHDVEGGIACFVTQRKGAKAIIPAPRAAMIGIAKNLGRPSDFQREGGFGDEPQPIAPELMDSEV
ncbi:AAA family ATPase [Candidatus Chloroploca sp. Khr17]|uniref:AAA family ATPase n=1 Tax=Candidatus Chloroploca sp. Khr17 TaxID=2496869 RepID=UPI00101E1E68|nr:ATP-binding protein [Candidatus Chloroploca sp. Khr17]